MKVQFTNSIENLQGVGLLRGQPLHRVAVRFFKSLAERTTYLPLAVLVSPLIAIVFLISGGSHLLLHGRWVGAVPLLIGVSAAVFVIFFVGPWGVKRRLRKRMMDRRILNTAVNVEIDEDGFHYLLEDMECHLAWSQIRALTETHRHVFVMDRRSLSYIIPSSAFSTYADRVAFCDFVRSRIANKPTAA